MTALALNTFPVSSFIQLAWGRTHETLDDEQIRQLLQRIMSREGGQSVAVEVLGMRIFGLVSDDLPVSESLRTTSRDFLAKVEFSDDGRLEHVIDSLIGVGFDGPEYEDQARNFCRRMAAAIGGWRFFDPNMQRIATRLAKTFPALILDTLAENVLDKYGVPQTALADIGDGGTSAFSVISDDDWAAWAARQPETRFEIFAWLVPISGSTRDGNADTWSRQALKLIEAAPDPAKPLNVFLRRFHPSGYSGLLSDALASRVPLIEVLKHHANADIVAWANLKAPAFAETIAARRALESAESRARDQTFE